VSVISPRRAESWRTRVLDYVALTKPRIMLLLLITAAGGAFAAARGIPSIGALVGVLAGGALASGGASALNHVLERHLDELMGRTHVRAAQSVGLTLGEIKEILAFRDRGETPCQHVASLIERHAEDLSQRIAALERMRRDLERLSRKAKAAAQTPSRGAEFCHIIETSLRHR
jgi:hypothetical protein